MNVAAVTEQVEHYVRYARRPHAIEMYSTVVSIAFISFLLPFLMLMGMMYINMGHDATVIQVEQNIHDALESLESSPLGGGPKELERFISKQKRFETSRCFFGDPGEESAMAGFYCFFNEVLGLAFGSFALFVGLSSTIIAWRSERRATIQFIVDMKDNLTALDLDKATIMTGLNQ